MGSWCYIWWSYDDAREVGGSQEGILDKAKMQLKFEKMKCQQSQIMSGSGSHNQKETQKASDTLCKSQMRSERVETGEVVRIGMGDRVKGTVDLRIYLERNGIIFE